MKNLIILFSVCLTTMIGQAQPAQKEEPLLTAYYSVKDALVSGDVKLASEQAKDLGAQLDAFAPAKVDAKTQKQLKELKDKVKSDASKIANSTALASQREAFTPLSTNFFELAKLFDLSPSPVYQFYCPMKKAIWLSSESSVKNPYYGKQMLTCGSLQETLK
jgi:hypothetical protein